MSIKDIYQLYLRFPSIQTDSRKVQPGDMFFALKGENFDGNQFAIQALHQGAACAVVDNHTLQHSNIIVVQNVLHTLQQLALFHRQQFNIPFIAITGSNGKTTTKELLLQVLQTTFITAATEGNLNNHIGIPLTLLKIKKDTQIAIIEMGANHQKEIEAYCQYVLPTWGVITNIGKAHMGSFGGVEGIKKGKGELFHFLAQHQTTGVFVHSDDEYLMTIAQNIPTKIYYGTNAHAHIQGKIKSNNPFLSIDIAYKQTSFQIHSHLVGDYNLPNILCAVAAGTYFGVPTHAIQQSIQDYQPNNARSQYVKKKSNIIILDAYNANPSSMELAIKNFASMHASKKILCLGEMKELGEESKNEHQKIIQLIAQYNTWHQVFLVGQDFFTSSNPHFHVFKTVEQLITHLQTISITHAHVLVKGSRATRMEKIMDVL